MPDSIRERLEKQVRAKLIADLSLDARHVQRVARDGNDCAANDDGTLPGHWLLIIAGDEDNDTDEHSLGTAELVLPLTVDIHILTVPDAMTIAEHANALRATVVQSLLSEPQWPEDASGDELALESFVVGTYGPMPGYEGDGGGNSGGGVRDWLCGVEIEIRYRHAEADPYTRI